MARIREITGQVVLYTADGAQVELTIKASSMLNLTESFLPEYGPNSLDSYWVALHEVYFDEPPDITITGDFSSIGLPYGDDDPDDAVF